MNADSHFEIGKDHLICEDYALAGQDDKGAYAIVCDGCSSSPSVDLGARVLAYSALQCLRNGLMDDYTKFGHRVIRNAGDIFNVLTQLHPQALDATLLVATVQGGATNIYMYGDGVMYQKYTNGDVRAVHVNFPLGAPAYLSYYLDDNRLKDYEDNVKTKKVTEVVIKANGERFITEKILEPFEPVKVEANFVVEGDLIALSSDGINSFRKADSDLMPWTDLTEEFFNYKNTSGVFVTRRLAAFQRKCLKEQMTHFDDIAVASIIV